MPEPDPLTAPSPRAGGAAVPAPLQRLTTQGWLTLVLTVTAVLTVVGSLSGAFVLDRTAAVSNRLADRIQPARAAVVELRTAWSEQQTAVRGFVLSGDRQFLAPYQAAGGDRHADELRRLLAGEAGLLAGLNEVQRRGRAWREQYAAAAVAGRTGGRPEPPELTGRGAALAGELASAVGRLDAGIAAAQVQGRADLGRARAWRDLTFVAILAVFVLTGIAVAVLLRTAVLAPLRRLQVAARRVAVGDFEHRLVIAGPADLRELAGDVDAMRRRVTDELARVRDSQERLEEQATELRRSNAELEQFAYVASHDLQEPLRKVASFCQLLQRRYGEQLDDRARQYIGFAVDGASRMQTLINDLLSFSRVGRLYDRREPVELAALLDAVTANLAVAIDDAGAEITVAGQLPVVTGDPTLLGMLWQNLLGNAVKFRSPDRAPRITVSVVDGGERWQFAVQDNGIGIDPEYADKIFVIFQRLHAREAYPGTGIGLAMCKKIVEFYGGRIWLDPEPREGTRLCFTLAKDTPTGDEANSVDLASVQVTA